MNFVQEKLQVAQNKVIRFIDQLGPRERITYKMLSELYLVNVDTRVKLLKLNHVRKIVHNKYPSYMSENFVNVTAVHQYQTRSRGYNLKFLTVMVPKVQLFIIHSLPDR